MKDTSIITTILAIVILVVLVGFVVWFVRGGLGDASRKTDDGSVDVNVNLPAGNDQNGGDTSY